MLAEDRWKGRGIQELFGLGWAFACLDREIWAIRGGAAEFVLAGGRVGGEVVHNGAAGRDCSGESTWADRGNWLGALSGTCSVAPGRLCGRQRVACI
jgi:hypothetical protein